MLHVFISPHLDDAVASCGGTIASLVKSGESPVIYNLCAGEAPPPHPPFASALHRLWGSPPDVVRLRRAEDAAAAARLGAAVHCAAIPDSLYRRDRSGAWMYPHEGQIFGARHRDDDRLVSLFRCHVSKFIFGQAAQLYAPLGIGGHVDHLIAFEVAASLHRDAAADVLFYEDVPYAFEDDAWRQRLSELPGWACQLVALTPQDVDLKLEALSYYHSQIRMLFGTAGRMRTMVRRFAAKRCAEGIPLSERYWRPTSRPR